MLVNANINKLIILVINFHDGKSKELFFKKKKWLATQEAIDADSIVVASVLNLSFRRICSHIHFPFQFRHIDVDKI